MELSISVSPMTDDWERLTAYIAEAERIGVEQVWTGENWSHDCASRIAFIAAHTSTMKLGAIMQSAARTPAMTAMTATSLQALSRGRMSICLAASGPQVIEGLHGVPFQPAIQRIREVIEMVRIFARGDRLVYEGRVFQVPRPGGEGKPLRTTGAPRSIPIYVASLSPKSLEMTGEIADGWLGSSFMPEHAEVFLRHLRAGAERAGRSLADLTLRVPGGRVLFTDDVERYIPERKKDLVFTLTSMGSKAHNFYRDAYDRSGFEDVTHAVMADWAAGKRDEAGQHIPDEMVLGTNLIGTEDMVRDRLRAHRKAGVNTLRIDPVGDPGEQLDALARLVALTKEVNEEAPA